MEHFCALKPAKFDVMVELWRAKLWLHKMDLIFKAMEYSEMEKLRLATFQLSYAVVSWWEAKEVALGGESVRRMPWAIFKERFLAKCFPLVERNWKKKEFMELVQGNCTVQEYTMLFERISRFAPHMVDTPAKKNE